MFVYLAKNNLIGRKQSAFKSTHLTETALFMVFEAAVREVFISSALVLLDLLLSCMVTHQIFPAFIMTNSISGTPVELLSKTYLH